MASKKPFLSFVIEEELLNDIDNYRFKNHFPNRASAIKHLIKIGLEQEESRNN